MDNTQHNMTSNTAGFSSEDPKDDGRNVSVTSAGFAVPSEYDADGEVKQDGVRRTEAITSVWDRKTLVFVFVT